jgi:hypothetical protein
MRSGCSSGRIFNSNFKTWLSPIPGSLAGSLESTRFHHRFYVQEIMPQFLRFFNTKRPNVAESASSAYFISNRPYMKIASGEKHRPRNDKYLSLRGPDSDYAPITS